MARSDYIPPCCCFSFIVDFLCTFLWALGCFALFGLARHYREASDCFLAVLLNISYISWVCVFVIA
jgi:hypothetical protein